MGIRKKENNARLREQMGCSIAVLLDLRTINFSEPLSAFVQITGVKTSPDDWDPANLMSFAGSRDALELPAICSTAVTFFAEIDLVKMGLPQKRGF